ncbi:MAG: PEP-CTERM sorting domain-containing protein [Planctomycetales bacterium]|nr:PEP-CTERM sorting domain-containing protein [Planctomycetales bacterium]
MRFSVRSMLVIVAALAMAAQASAGIISSVNAVSSSVTPTIETLVDGVNIYHDRDPGHRLVNVPTEFEGDADVIVASNSDKTLATYQLEVTTNKLGIIYVGLDSRHVGSQPLPWMQDTSMTGLPTIFFDTGRTVDIDEGSTAENAGDDINGSFNLWATIAPAGTYNFFEQTFGGGSNNYFIAADNKLISVPEPATASMLVIACLGLFGLVRRR